MPVKCAKCGKEITNGKFKIVNKKINRILRGVFSDNNGQPINEIAAIEYYCNQCKK